MFTLQKEDLIHTGSVKKLYRVAENRLVFLFTDQWSAFDTGPHQQIIPGKAQAVCACAVRSAQIAKQVGVPTHFIEQIGPTAILVQEVQRITSRHLTTNDQNCVVPAEWISRFQVAGSIHRDFANGRKKPTDFGFPTDDLPAVGTPFPCAVHQFTTKFEEVDRELSNEQAYALTGLTPKDAAEYWGMIDRLNGAISLALFQAGFAHIDGKMECLLGPGRTKMIGDVFGTPDEDRFCPRDKLRQGEIAHYSKEYLREELIRMGYYTRLLAARSRGLAKLPYPDLRDEQIAEASRRYCAVAKAYAGVTIRV